MAATAVTHRLHFLRPGIHSSGCRALSSPLRWGLRKGTSLYAEELASTRAHPLRRPPLAAATAHARRLAIVPVVLLSAALNVIGLNSEGYANTYYAAAVKSMAMNVHNFWFAAFDPNGFVAVDKPPLGLWFQVASVKIFGFNGVALLLPQALAGVLSVVVLYRILAPRFGPAAGVLGALVLAITPIAVVDNHNNTSDSVLILFLLLAVWAGLRAAETGRLRLLLGSAALLGLGFNIKELEAWMVAPAVAAVYLIGAPLRLRTRLLHLLAAGFALLVVSFAWIVAVDLTPASARPYVSDSGTNSELSLALGYNGIGRLLSGFVGSMPAVPILHVKLDLAIAPGFSSDIGSPGVFRLFLTGVGAQASWLLPAAVIALLAAVLTIRRLTRPNRQGLAVICWALWLLAAAGFFSTARFYHLYYLILLAPPVAALAGIGARLLWDDYLRALNGGRVWEGWLLPAAIAVTGYAQWQLLAGYSGWNGWLGPVIAVVALLVAAILVLGRLGVRVALEGGDVLALGRRPMLAAALIGAVTLLSAPAAFAADSVAAGNGSAWLPSAGPSTGFGGPRGGFGGPPGGGFFSRTGAGNGFPGTGRGGQPFGGAAPGAAGRSLGGPPGGFRGPAGGFGGGPGGGALTFAGADVPTLNAGLVRYLEQHRGSAKYLVATPTTGYASLFILQTGQAAMALGGYQGWDRILSLPALKRLIAGGTIRYFLVDGTSGGRGFGGGFGFRGGPGGSVMPKGDTNLNAVNDDLTNWITSSCRAIPSSAYQTGSTAGTGSFGRFDRGGNIGSLYDCAAAARS